MIGAKSLAALAEFQADSERIADELGVFDKRSEASIATMLLATQRAARKFLNAVDTAGLSTSLTVRIISGSRTFDEQNKLFEQGRTTPGDVVTNARGARVIISSASPGTSAYSTVTVPISTISLKRKR